MVLNPNGFCYFEITFPFNYLDYYGGQQYGGGANYFRPGNVYRPNYESRSGNSCERY